MDIKRTSMLAAGMLLLAGCAPTPPKASQRLRIVTTIGVLADWARQVGGDRVEVTSLLTGNESPHTYEAKPQDAVLLARADVLFRVGLGLEEWLNPVVENAGNKRLVVVDAATGITSIIADTERQPKSEARSERREARTSESLAPSPQPPVPVRAGNPHIWLDPEYAKAGIENLVRELVKLDPKGESLYRRREAGYREQLDSLEAAISRQVAGLPDKRFISFHEAWPYFARRFGFTIVATVEPIPGQEPSAKELVRLVDLIRREKIKVITTEPQLPSALPEMLARETGVKIVSLNPLEYEGGYIAVLGTSANVLINALR
jgi:ABC-type Zn uptake system ZnuABC Zn-binding protein ZnuA